MPDGNIGSSHVKCNERVYSWFSTANGGCLSVGNNSMDTISTTQREFTTKRFWASILAEFIAVTFLVYTISSVSVAQQLKDSDELYIALAYGFGAAGLVLWSNGLMNPALAVAFCSTGKLSFVKGVLFIIMEILGGIAGTALTHALTPEKLRKDQTFGDTILAEDMSTIQGLFLEFILTFMLTMVVYASNDPGRKCEGYQSAMAYGFAVMACHLVGCQYTRCGFNPSRSFGAAIMRELSGSGKPQSEWESHWIFWIGPMCGALLAGVLYHFLFAQCCVEYEIYQSSTANNNHGAQDSETVL